MGGRFYRAGDRVMQIRNNYDKEVFNGDMGRITEVEPGRAGRHRARWTTAHVRYDFLELDELVHAYAVSIHKAQGSEFPAVVIPLLTTHYMMLQRNLLYTAVTRAQKLVVLVGSPRAIGIAVRADRAQERYSGLARRLRTRDKPRRMTCRSSPSLASWAAAATMFARAVAERLGLRLIGRELINRAARAAGVPEVALAEIDELGLLGVKPTPRCAATVPREGRRGHPRPGGGR